MSSRHISQTRLPTIFEAGHVRKQGRRTPTAQTTLGEGRTVLRDASSRARLGFVIWTSGAQSHHSSITPETSMITRLVIAIPDASADAFRSGPIGSMGWLSRVDFSTIADQLPPDYVELHYLHTDDVLQITSHHESTESILRDRWRKRGWSEAKMNRTLRDMHVSRSRRFFGLHDDLRHHIAAAAARSDPIYLYAFPLPPPTSITDRIRVSPEQLIEDSSLVQLNRLIEVRSNPPS